MRPNPEFESLPLSAGASGPVGALLDRNMEKQAVRLSILRGELDANKLTNQVFFSRHKEHEGRRIDARKEPHLAKEWQQILESVVRPALVEAARGSNARAILGIDVYSGDIPKPPDWVRARDEGKLGFAIIKASQGVWADAAFKREWPRIKAAGLVRGAYMFLNLPSVKRPNREDPVAQAKKFIATVGKLDPGDLPPSLDVEFPGGRARTKASAKQCLADVRTAWKVLADFYGVAPIIYTSNHVWRDDLDNLDAPDLTESPLWVTPYITGYQKPAIRDLKVFADGRHDPKVPRPWGDATNWWIHQYQGDARQFPGFFQVDMNRFNTMSAGAAGDRVKWVQRRLGIAPGGSFDATTEKALRAFQQQKGLAADGVIDIRTFAFLCWANPGRGGASGGGSVGASRGQSEFGEWEWFDPEAREADFEWMGEVSRTSPDYVRWLQQSLNQILGLRLAVDGAAGTQTRSAVRSFQERNGLTVDGAVGPQTEGALVRAGAPPPPGSPAAAAPYAPASAGGYAGIFPSAGGGASSAPGSAPAAAAVSLVNVPGIEKTGQSFRDKVVRIARDIGTDPNFLMAIMSFESTLDPKAVNKYTDATGLIQFMPKTAERLGTSTVALRGMTAEQQLDYVWKYFAPYKGRLTTLEDAYMAVLYPSAIGKGSSHVLFSTPTDAYRYNSVLDLDHDGHVTVAEAASMVRKKLPAGYPTTWGGGAGYAGPTAPAATTPAPAPSAVGTAGINTPLPQAGPGFYSYTSAGKRFGLSKTIQAVLAIAAEWARARPAGPLLGIGNISLQGGGPFPPHSSHQKGVDVDIRPLRNDGKNEPTTYKSSTYSRELTQQLVNIICANSVLSVRTILFNDSNVSGVKPYTGHDDHLHINFNTPT